MLQHKPGHLCVSIDGESQRWRCHDCGIGGTIIDVVMQAEGVDIKQALAHLEAPSTGIDLKQRSRLASHSAWRPYVMNGAEIARSADMAAALLSDHQAVEGIARARNWQPETIVALAQDPSIGLLERKLVYIYPTGAKQRFRPLTATAAAAFKGPPFRWLFGKPHALWRADQVCQETQRIHVTEGETAAISLIDSGIESGWREVVVATPGASTWRDEWAALFAGRNVTLWPDGDAPGEAQARRIVASIEAVARSVETVSIRQEVAA